MLILDRKLVRRRYLLRWFVLDAVSSVPVQIIGMINEEVAAELLPLKLIRLLKLGRLSNASNLKVIKSLSYSGVIRPGVVRLARLLLAYFFVTHFVACCYWGIAKTSPVECADGVLDFGGQFPWGVCLEGVEEHSFAWQYGRSFYWALIVMMGNESYPIRHTDRAFTSVVILVGMVVNSVVRRTARTAHAPRLAPRPAAVPRLLRRGRPFGSSRRRGRRAARGR